MVLPSAARRPPSEVSSLGCNISETAQALERREIDSFPLGLTEAFQIWSPRRSGSRRDPWRRSCCARRSGLGRRRALAQVSERRDRPDLVREATTSPERLQELRSAPDLVLRHQDRSGLQRRPSPPPRKLFPPASMARWLEMELRRGQELWRRSASTGVHGLLARLLHRRWPLAPTSR